MCPEQTLWTTSRSSRILYVVTAPFLMAILQLTCSNAILATTTIITSTDYVTAYTTSTATTQSWSLLRTPPEQYPPFRGRLSHPLSPSPTTCSYILTTRSATHLPIIQNQILLSILTRSPWPTFLSVIKVRKLVTSDSSRWSTCSRHSLSISNVIPSILQRKCCETLMLVKNVPLSCSEYSIVKL